MVTRTLKRYGYSFEAGAPSHVGDALLVLMFGEGMGNIWTDRTQAAGYRGYRFSHAAEMVPAVPLLHTEGK